MKGPVEFIEVRFLDLACLRSQGLYSFFLHGKWWLSLSNMFLRFLVFLSIALHKAIYICAHGIYLCIYIYAMLCLYRYIYHVCFIHVPWICMYVYIRIRYIDSYS